MTRRKIEFIHFEEAQYHAGLFITQCCDKLCISKRTYYRWKESGYVPMWAYNHIELLSGRLDQLGWKYCRIERGVLYNMQLSLKYNWEPVDLLKPFFKSG